MSALPQMIVEALARIRAEARAAGYAEGFAAGREAERAELLAAMLDAVGGAAQVAAPQEDRPRVGVASAPNTGAPGPSPVVVAGPPPVSPPLPGAAPADAALAPGTTLPARQVQRRAMWKTAGRAARLREIWGDPAWTVRAIRRELAVLEGPAMPPSWQVVYAFAAELGLGSNRGGVMPGARAAQQDTRAGETGAAVPERPPTQPGGVSPAKAVDEDAGQDTGAADHAPSVPPAPQPGGSTANTGGESPAPPEPRDDAADEAPAPAGLRETPQMVRARELLAMGLHPNDIRTAVKLSVAEFAAIRRAHAAASA